MDGRLPAQFCCSLQVAARQGLIPLRGQAAVVNPVLLARPLQRPVCFPPPDLPGLCNPVFVHHRPALLGPASLRLLPVGPLEPLLRAPLQAVVGPLTDYQVRVGILPAFPAPVDGQRIGQPLFPGQPLGEAAGQVAALPLVQLHGQRHFYLLEQPPVATLVLVCRLPVRARIVLRPLRQVAALFVFQFCGVLGIAALAPKVIILGAGRLPAAASAGFHVQVKDGHALPLPFPPHRISLREMLRCALHYRSGMPRSGPLPLPATKLHGSIQAWSVTLKKYSLNSRRKS